VTKAEVSDRADFGEAYRQGFRAVMRRGGGQPAANRVIRGAVLEEAQRDAVVNGA